MRYRASGGSGVAPSGIGVRLRLRISDTKP
jgi:hypothetical protein